MSATAPPIEMTFFDRSLDEETRQLVSNVADRQAATPSVYSTERHEAKLKALLAAFTDTEEWERDRTRMPDSSAFLYGWQFLEALPSSVPIPEVTFEADGDVSFDWDYGPRQVASVRISRDGFVYYAGLFGYATEHGAEAFGERIPARVAEVIGRAVAGSSTS